MFPVDHPFTSAAYSEAEKAEGSPSPPRAALSPTDEPTADDSVRENTVLIVEDDVEMRNYIRHLLSGDYNLIMASNGAEALDRLSVGCPDLIVSDVVMPRKDGYELWDAVKSSPDYGHIPIVLLTAKAT